MRPVFALSASLLLVGCSHANRSPEARHADVVAELNYARQQPQAYADLIQQWAGYFEDKVLARPGVARWRTNEGAPAELEAAQVLRATQPMAALRELPPLDEAADDHVREQGPRGGEGHYGADGSGPGDRIRRHAKELARWGEAIQYGFTDVREVVVFLLVDDGVPSRGHRKLVLNPAFRSVGVGIGAHATFKQMCVLDFAE